MPQSLHGHVTRPGLCRNRLWRRPCLHDQQLHAARHSEYNHNGSGRRIRCATLPERHIEGAQLYAGAELSRANGHAE